MRNCATEWINLPLLQVLTILVSSSEMDMLIGCYGDPPSANFPKLRGREEDLDVGGNWFLDFHGKCVSRGIQGS